jgi:hypothetical protein
MTRIRADKYEQGQWPYPRSSAANPFFVRYSIALKAALANRNPVGMRAANTLRHASSMTWSFGRTAC